MFNILLVEDDDSIREGIVDYFHGMNTNEQKNSGMEVHVYEAADGDVAMDMVYENNYDLILLDIMLPGAGGFEVCKAVRSRCDTPIIFITARSRQEDIMYGYDLGCDDYIIKPFLLPVLYSKVRALINRDKGLVRSQSIVVGNISLNPRSMLVVCSGNEIDLAPKEYVILKILMENKNNVIGRDELITRVWGYDYDGNERVVDNHIKKLRKALGKDGGCIKTVIGHGYRMVEK